MDRRSFFKTITGVVAGVVAAFMPVKAKAEKYDLTIEKLLAVKKELEEESDICGTPDMLYDPLRPWAKAAAEAMNKRVDEQIIRALI